ncbi:MAG: FAD-dependent oxidoreductase [Acidobacteriia bacterium]|nr:FAD-dependent oxidoreductase [Terriglobia bacterium]
MHAKARSVLVVGSGLAGLTCAAELAASGRDALVVSPGRAGRDGATHRVHALAPWILLTAPWVRGDSPTRFFDDLKRRGLGLERSGLAEVLADSSHAAALRLIEDLDLEPMDAEPVTLAGDELPRGLRCLPRNRHIMLAPALTHCAAVGVRVRERTLVFGLLIGEDRVVGAVVVDRDGGGVSSIEAEAVVLACGGGGAVFPVTTSPRWCRGTGLALASAAAVLLHRPGLAQALPVTATPPLFFPSSAALVHGRIEIGSRALPADRDVEATTVAIAGAARAGTPALFEPIAETASILPARVRASAAFKQSGRIPLTVALHHCIGGVAIDTWGRTSLPGLYACGEAAGGVQGQRRTMGTGLLEAAVFGRRAAQAIIRDQKEYGPRSERNRRAAVPGLPFEPAAIEHRLDELLGPLVVLRPPDEVESAVRELRAWPLGDFEPSLADEASAFAGIRRQAALAMLGAFREDRSADAPGAPPAGSGEGRWTTSA